MERKIRTRVESKYRPTENIDLDTYLERHQTAEQKELLVSGTFSPPRTSANDFVNDKQINSRELVIKKIEQDSRTKKKSNVRDQDINSFQKKIIKMHDCLTIILNSYHCSFQAKMVAEPEGRRKERQRYTFYIGPGNNGNLVRSLMRKRCWWTEVDSTSKANLVWTQLRLPGIIEKMELLKD